MANRMKIKEAGFVGLMLVCAIAAGSLFVPYARAQQDMPPPPAVMTTDRSLTVENDKVQTSADHHYNSPAERANDDLLITEVKSSLAEQRYFKWVSSRSRLRPWHYPVERSGRVSR